MDANELLPILAAALIGFAFNAWSNRGQVTTNQGLSLATLDEKIKTLFRRVEDVEERQDDHADNHNELREMVIVLGPQVENVVQAVNRLIARWDVMTGEGGGQPITIPRNAPARKTTRAARVSQKQRRVRR